MERGNLESIVEACIGATIVDRVYTRLGWLCSRNSDFLLGPRWLITFNYPMEIDEWDYISQFIRDAEPSTVRSLYRSCNGMKIANNNFIVPGIQVSSELNSDDDFFNIPYSITTCGGYLLPEKAPVNGFVAGISHVVGSQGVTRKLYDIIDSRGAIVSGFFADSEDILNSFSCLEEWIGFQTGQAISRFHRVRLARLN